MRVLLIGLDPMTKPLLEGLLKNRYHQTTICQDGEAALSECESNVYPLVFIEYSLTGLSSVDLCPKIRETKGGKNSVVYLITPSRESVILDEILAAGADDFIAKPIDVAVFKARLVIAEHRASERAKRRMAEDKFRWEEQRSRSFVDGCVDMIQSVGLDGKFQFVNRAWLENLGYSAEEVSQLSIFDIIHPNCIDYCREMFQSVLDGKLAKNIETTFISKQGKDLVLEGNAVPHYLDGRLVGTQGFFHEVTRKRELEQAAEKAKAHLYQSDKMKTVGLLAGSVAHEINNPLAFVHPNLQTLEESFTALLELVSLYARGAERQEIEDFRKENELDQVLAEIPEILRESLGGVERITKITQELLLFTREGELLIEPTNLTEVLESSLNLIANLIQLKARVKKEYAQIPLISTCRGRMGQVVLSILINALEAMDKERIDQNMIRLTTGVKDDQVFIEIANNGRPIAADIRDKIFDPFFTTKLNGEGTGLGLSISYSFVEQLGGTLVLQSNVDRETVFRITLPRAEEMPDHGEEKEAVLPASTRPARVLVIDDEVPLLHVFGRVLRKHEVKMAANGADALAIVASWPDIDIVFCDLMMPGVNGMEVYAEVSQSYPDLAKRFVFLTGGTYTAEAKTFVRNCKNSIFEKPIKYQKMIELVEQAVLAQDDR